jgi:hypothetical protein
MPKFEVVAKNDKVGKVTVEAAGYAIEGGDLTFYKDLDVTEEKLSGRVASFRQWVSVIEKKEK